MSRPVIRVENVSKLYHLGELGTGKLSTDFSRWWAKTFKGHDPYTKIDAKNEPSSKEYWALKDITFDVNQGDVLGIIGKNGAGKSTLLKILSRITTPTSGHIKVKGRIASLLEVGTGFHPDLTGRENVYLNGSFLGMRKKEIDAKFDEIVDFSGIEKFIDTPVKRYSSGMYVRLAFAVAAHLEPEILIIDEVLAVGDAEFQAKCLGKMKDVSAREGRTVLFVSHNILAIQSLCDKGVFLKSGSIASIGKIEKVINSYLKNEQLNYGRVYNSPTLESAIGNEYVKVVYAEIESESSKKEIIDVTMPLKVKFKFYLYEETDLNLSLVLWTLKGECIFNVGSTAKKLQKGYHESTLFIPSNLLNDDHYTIELYFVKEKSIVIFKQPELLSFEVADIPREGGWYGKWIGAVRPKLDFTIIENVG